MYKISIQVFIRVDLHKKFHPILIIWRWDIELWKLAKLKTFLQFRWSSKLYISAATDQNWVKFFVQIDPNENLDWYFIHHGHIWLQFCLRVITKCMNLPLGCMNLPFTMVYDGGEKGIDMPCKCHVGAVLGQPHLRLTMVEPDFWFVTSYTLFFKSTRNEKRKYFKHSMCGFYIWKV